MKSFICRLLALFLIAWSGMSSLSAMNRTIFLSTKHQPEYLYNYNTPDGAYDYNKGTEVIFNPDTKEIGSDNNINGCTIYKNSTTGYWLLGPYDGNIARFPDEQEFQIISDYAKSIAPAILLPVRINAQNQFKRPDEEGYSAAMPVVFRQVLSKAIYNCGGQEANEAQKKAIVAWLNGNDICPICYDKITKPRDEITEPDKCYSIALPCSHVFHRKCLEEYNRKCLNEDKCITCPACDDVGAGFAIAGFFDPDLPEDVKQEKAKQFVPVYAKALLAAVDKENSSLVKQLVDAAGKYLNEVSFFQFITALDFFGMPSLATIGNSIEQAASDGREDQKALDIEKTLTDAAAKYLNENHLLIFNLDSRNAGMHEAKPEKCVCCPRSIDEDAPQDQQDYKLRPEAPKIITLNCTEPFEAKNFDKVAEKNLYDEAVANNVAQHKCHTACLANLIIDENGSFNIGSACPYCSNPFAMAAAYNQLIDYMPGPKRSPVYALCPAELINAARKNDFVEVQKIIKQAQENFEKLEPSSNTDQLFEFITTPGLHNKSTLDWACEHENAEMVNFLLDSMGGKTLLAKAASNDNVVLLKSILAAMQEYYPGHLVESLKQENNEAGETALMYAARNGNSGALRVILEAMKACLTDYPDRLVELLKQGKERAKTVWMYAVHFENPMALQIIFDFMQECLPGTYQKQLGELLSWQSDKMGNTVLSELISYKRIATLKFIFDVLQGYPILLLEALAQKNEAGEDVFKHALFYENPETLQVVFDFMRKCLPDHSALLVKLLTQKNQYGQIVSRYIRNPEIAAALAKILAEAQAALKK